MNKKIFRAGMVYASVLMAAVLGGCAGNENKDVKQDTVTVTETMVPTAEITSAATDLNNTDVNTQITTLSKEDLTSLGEKKAQELISRDWSVFANYKGENASLVKSAAVKRTAQSVVPERVAEVSNDSAKGGICHAPYFSKPSGMYADEIDVTITLEDKSDDSDAGKSDDNSKDSSKIYYTTDGSNPLTSAARTEYKQALHLTDATANENVYSAIDPAQMNQFYGPNDVSIPEYLVDKCNIIRAVAVFSDGTRSDIATSTYFIGDTAADFSDNNIAVMSITTDPANLFDYNTGIYVNGVSLDDFKKQNPDEEWMYWGTANYRQKGSDWEREIHMDFFESDGSLAYSTECGLRIAGGYSRGDIQKSLRFIQDKDYSGDKNFKYAFFDDLKDSSGKNIEKFKSLVARTGANDAFYCKFKDSYLQKLVEDRDLSTQAGRPCIIFIDGEYWGLYTLEEDYTADYFADNYGVKKSDVVMVKATDDYKAELETGDDADFSLYTDMVDFFKSADLSDSASYEKACEYMDVDSFADYCAFEIYIINEDWPGKNWGLWRTRNADSSNPYADGKWRFCTYDLEMGVYHYGNASTKYDVDRISALLGDYKSDSTNISLFFYKFMQNEEFKAKLARALLDMAEDNFESNRAFSVMENYTDTYFPEMFRFFDRFKIWASFNSATKGCYKNMVTFLEGRDEYVPEMIKKAYGLDMDVNLDEKYPKDND
jgi:hypothetical protein